MAGKKSEETTTITWTGTAGIETAKSLQKELQKAINNNSTVYLNISEIDDIDLTGIQLILAAKIEADNQNKTFAITGKIPQAISEFVSSCSVSFEPLLKKQEEENA